MRFLRYYWLRVFITSLISAASSPAFSYCYVAWQGSVEFRASDATTACRALIDFANPGNISRQYGYGGIGTGSGGDCYFYRNTTYEVLGQWRRGGEQTTVCEAAPPNGEPCGVSSAGGGVEKIKNSGGQCVEPWDADKPSFCKYLSRNTRFQTVPVQYREDGTVIPPPSITSVEGCEATPLDFSNCKMPVARKACANGNCVTLQPLQGNCRVATNFTGNVANNSVPSGQFTGAPGNTPGLCKPGEDCIGPTPPNVTNNQPCTYTTDAEGRKVCTSFNFNGKPGNGFSCGTFNGEMKCYGKVPNSTGSQITTTVSTQNQSNGNTTTTTTNNYQNTICSAPGACTTTTTTTTNINVKGPSGDTISDDTTCTGPHCSQTGAGGKGDSDGDGIDDCATGKDCSGENVAGVPGAPDLDDAAEINDSTGDYFGRISNAPIVSAITKLVIPTGGSCPVYSRQTMIGTLETSSFCNLAPEILGGLRVLFLALWAWAAVRLFMTA